MHERIRTEIRNRSASPALRFSTPLYDFVRFGTLLSARLLADEPFEINLS
jgi:hypothetical protein